MATDDFFRTRLERMIDLRYPLAVLARRLLWAQIEAALALAFARKHRPGRTTEVSDLFSATMEIAGGGHVKSEDKLGRNWLKGALGDVMHAALCGAGHNQRLVIGRLRLFYADLLVAILRMLPLCALSDDANP